MVVRSDLVRKINELRTCEVGKLVARRMQEFKNLGRKGNEEWFSELCFCILTANSTAKLGIKIQSELGSKGFLSLPEAEIRKKLRQLRHRFYNPRAEYIVMARRFNDIKSIINEFADVQQAREWLAEDVKGIGYKEASLPGWERVLVLIGGEMRNEPIEKVAEMFHSKSRRDVRTFSFNPETLKFEIAQVTNVFTHVYNGDLYEFQLQTGRKVVVTGNHSLFTLSGGGVTAVEARKLKVGDFVAIPRHLPEVCLPAEKINVIEELLKKKITKDVYVRSKAYNKFLQDNYGPQLKRKNQYTQRFRGILPLVVLR